MMKWKPQAGKPAMVMVADAKDRWADLEDPGNFTCHISASALSEPPTPITPEERAVVEAADMLLALWDRYDEKGRHTHKEAERFDQAVREWRETQKKRDPKAELLEAWNTAEISSIPDEQQQRISNAIDAIIRAMEAGDGQ